jgi:hypothetical protein
MSKIIDFRTKEQIQDLKKPENKDLVSVIFILSKSHLDKLKEFQKNEKFKNISYALGYMIYYMYYHFKNRWQK